MSNHFHFVMETPRANLVTGMKWLLGTYTMAFNRRHRLSGHLFAGRYKSLLIDESSPLYLRAVCDYVHLNPARAGILKDNERLEAYRWSSYPSYLGKVRARWLRCDRLPGEHGFMKETRRTKLELSRRLEARRHEKPGQSEQEIHKGWILGAEDFVARLVDRCEGEGKARRWAAARTETEEELARRIVSAGMKELGWGAKELRNRSKSDAAKLALDSELRKNTSMSLKWIAHRLEMGSWSNVSNLLGQTAKSED